MSTFFNGNEQILYLVIDSVDCPIACLTESNFSESVETIETTTVDNGGWTSSRPTNQSYNIDFSGVLIDDSLEASKHSLMKLRVIKRARTLVTWKIALDGVFEQTGEGYITEISEASPSGEFITFSGSIVGYGQPTIVEQLDTVYTYQDNNTLLFDDVDQEIGIFNE